MFATNPETSPARVLVVDDEDAVRRLVTRALHDDGCLVEEFENGAALLGRLALAPRADLVILDIALPDASGFDVLREIRQTKTVPVILLTGHSDENDRVFGLQIGADDYVVKPFFPRELAARVRTVLRRAEPDGSADHLEFPNLVINRTTHEATVRGIPIELTHREFGLLAFMAASPRRVFSREELLQRVWGSSGEWQDPATVTEHVRRIRHKIEEDVDHPKWLVTVRGAGYRFDPAA